MKTNLNLTEAEFASLFNYADSYYTSVQVMISSAQRTNAIIIAEMYPLLCTVYNKNRFLPVGKRKYKIPLNYSDYFVLFHELLAWCPNEHLQFVLEKVTKTLVNSYNFLPNKQIEK